MRISKVVTMTLLAVVLAACSGPQTEDSGAQTPESMASAEAAAADGEELVAALGDPHLALPAGSKEALDPWTGDFDAMVERRIVRALVVPNRISYFLDGPNQQGVAYELLTQFEDRINEGLQSGHLKVYVVIIPTSTIILCLSSLSSETRFAAYSWLAIWVMGMVSYLLLEGQKLVQFRVAYEPSQWSLISLYHTMGRIQTWIFGLESRFSSVLPSILWLLLITVATLSILRRRVTSPIRI